MTHNFERLKAHILPLSVAPTFDAAKREWSLEWIEVSEEFDHCPCGQQIKEHCYIRNNANGNKTYVGNVCVNNFLGIDTGTVFAGLKRIAADSTANPNADLINLAYKAGYLYSEDEYKFLMTTRNKRSLSEKQIAWKQKINRRIVNKIVVKHRSAD